MSIGRTLRTLCQRHISTPRLVRRARNARAARGGHSTRPGVLIMGWYGLETLGDKAILSSILQQIEPGTRIIKATYDIAYSRATLQQIDAAHVECIGNDLRSFARALARVDVVVIGGGPLMGSREMNGWAERLGLAQQAGCRTMVYGCGVGPLDSDKTRTAVAAVLDRADAITLRDEVAMENAATLGVQRDRLTLTADPAFGLQGWGSDETARDNQTLRVGVSLRSFPRKCFAPAGATASSRSRDEISGALFEAAAATAARLLSERDAELHLVPMQVHASDDDRILLRSLKDRLGRGDRIHLVDDVDSPAAMLRRFTTFDFLIGMRFHSVVFGLLTHTPLVAIDYDMHVGKVTGIMHAMGLPEQVIGIGEVTTDRLSDLVMRSVDSRADIRRRITDALPNIKQRERRNGEQLRALMPQPRA